MDDYLSKSGDLLRSMRLLVEGASELFDGAALPLYGMGIKHDQLEAALAFDTIGTALTELRLQIIELQTIHTQFSRRGCS